MKDINKIGFGILLGAVLSILALAVFSQNYLPVAFVIVVGVILYEQ